MAKLKKSARKSTAAASGTLPLEGLSKTLSESAQQIWLAGVGAFHRAQSEGTKLFEALVKEGMSLEQTARKLAGHRAESVREAVESRVGQARERAADTWDKLEKVFEERVQRALVRLGVPGREDIAELSARVDALTAELRRQGGAPADRPARKSGVRKAAPRKAAKAPARKAAARRPADKPAPQA